MKNALRLTDPWMARALEVAEGSRDPSRQVGAVIYTHNIEVGVGCNNFIDEILESPDRWAKEEKSDWVVHAEFFAIMEAGARARGGSMVTTFFPCNICADLICLAGIQHLYAPPPDLEHPRWGKPWRAAVRKLDVRGVNVHQF